MLCSHGQLGAANGEIQNDFVGHSWSAQSKQQILVTWSLNFLCLSGCPIGTIFAQVVGGYLCSLSFLNGWSLIFYVVGKFYPIKLDANFNRICLVLFCEHTGVLGTVWSLFWMVLCKNTPQQHSGLSESERNYIEQSLISSRKLIRVNHCQGLLYSE